jgi:tetratricopeptide (TPR) repeat protein
MRPQSWILGAVIALSVGAGVVSAQATGGIAGRVMDDKGKPLAGAQILVVREGADPNKPQTVETDKRGQFTVERMFPGNYNITVTAEHLGLRLNKAVSKVTIGKTGMIPLGDIKLQALAPDNTNQFKKAADLADAGDYDGAIAIYNDVIAKATENKMKPADVAKLEMDLGVMYEKKKDHANAEAAYRKALDIDPDRTEAYDGLGNVYQAQNRPDEAIKLFQEAAAKQPTNGKFTYDLGLFLWSKGKNDEAYETLTKAAALLPDNPEVEYHLGVTAIGLNKNDEAITHLEKYLAMNPTNKDNIESAKTLIPAIKQTTATSPSTGATTGAKGTTKKK